LDIIEIVAKNSNLNRLNVENLYQPSDSKKSRKKQTYKQHQQHQERATSNEQQATSKSLRSQATQLLFKEYRYTYHPEVINTTIYDKLPVVNHGGHIIQHANRM